jgi:hypothetical protein
MLTEKELKERKEQLCRGRIILYNCEGNTLSYAPHLGVYIISYFGKKEQDEYWTYNEGQAVKMWNIIEHNINYLKQ